MKQYTKEEIRDLEEQKRELDKIIRNYYRSEALNTFNKHKDYVGKCYKSGAKYYKVLSQYASNEYRMTCLVFNLDEHVFSYEFIATLRAHEFPNMLVDLTFIELVDIFAFSDCAFFFDNVKEISNEEFNEKLETKLEQFKKEIDSLGSEIEEYVESHKSQYIRED